MAVGEGREAVASCDGDERTWKGVEWKGDSGVVQGLRGRRPYCLRVVVATVVSTKGRVEVLRR